MLRLDGLSWTIGDYLRMVSGFGIEPRFLLAPMMLVALFLIHFFYYHRSFATVGQQVIDIADLTNLASNSGRSREGALCVVGARNGGEGPPVSCNLPHAQLPPVPPASIRPRRFDRSIELNDARIAVPLICAEDLTIDGRTVISAALKVGGDLIILGDATFSDPVVVNGALHIKGSAHFQRGLITKGDAVVTGDIMIGTCDSEGWAVFRHFTACKQLRLNGQLICDQDSNFPGAA